MLVGVQPRTRLDPTMVSPIKRDTAGRFTGCQMTLPFHVGGRGTKTPGARFRHTNGGHLLKCRPSLNSRYFIRVAFHSSTILQHPAVKIGIHIEGATIRTTSSTPGNRPTVRRLRL
jgi:hypothetical protein